MKMTKTRIIKLKVLIEGLLQKDDGGEMMLHFRKLMGDSASIYHG